VSKSDYPADPAGFFRIASARSLDKGRRSAPVEELTKKTDYFGSRSTLSLGLAAHRFRHRGENRARQVRNKFFAPRETAQKPLFRRRIPAANAIR
jgi:hypothetical protein